MQTFPEQRFSDDNSFAQKQFIDAALSKADNELLKALLRKGVQIQDPFQAIESLHNAAEDGDQELVSLLLENGAGPHVNDVIQRVKDTALHLATRGGHTKVVKVLLDHSADVYALTSTRRCTYFGGLEFFVDENVRALHIAAEEGYYDITKYLLEGNSEIDALTEHGFTPLHLAVIENHVDVVKLLLQYRAMVCPLTGDGESIIDIANRRDLIHIREIIEEHLSFILEKHHYDEEDVAFAKELKKKKKTVKTSKKIKPSKPRITIERVTSATSDSNLIKQSNIQTNSFSHDAAVPVQMDFNEAEPSGHETIFQEKITVYDTTRQEGNDYKTEIPSDNEIDQRTGPRAVEMDDASCGDVDESPVRGGLILVKVTECTEETWTIGKPRDHRLLSRPETNSIDTDPKTSVNVDQPRYIDQSPTPSDPQRGIGAQSTTLTEATTDVLRTPKAQGHTDCTLDHGSTSRHDTISDGNIASQTDSCAPMYDTPQHGVQIRNLGKSSRSWNEERPIINVSIKSPKRKSPGPFLSTQGPFATTQYHSDRQFNTYKSYRSYMQEFPDTSQTSYHNVEGKTRLKEEKISMDQEVLGPLDDKDLQYSTEQKDEGLKGSRIRARGTFDVGTGLRAHSDGAKAKDKTSYKASAQSQQPVLEQSQEEEIKRELQPLLIISDDDDNDEGYLNDQTMIATISLLHKKYEYDTDENSSEIENDEDVPSETKSRSLKSDGFSSQQLDTIRDDNIHVVEKAGHEIDPDKEGGEYSVETSGLKQREGKSLEEGEKKKEDMESKEGDEGRYEEGTYTGPLMEKRENVQGILLESTDNLIQRATHNSPEEPRNICVRFQDESKKGSTGKPKRPSLPKSPIMKPEQSDILQGNFEYIDASSNGLTERFIPPEVFRAQEEEYLRRMGFVIPYEDDVDEDEFIKCYSHHASKYVATSDGENGWSHLYGGRDTGKMLGPHVTLPEKPRPQQEDPDHEIKLPGKQTLNWEIKTKKGFVPSPRQASISNEGPSDHIPSAMKKENILEEKSFATISNGGLPTEKLEKMPPLDDIVEGENKVKSLVQPFQERPREVKTQKKKEKKQAQETSEHKVTVRSKSGKKLRKKVKNQDGISKKEKPNTGTQIKNPINGEISARKSVCKSSSENAGGNEVSASGTDKLLDTDASLSLISNETEVDGGGNKNQGREQIVDEIPSDAPSNKSKCSMKGTSTSPEQSMSLENPVEIVFQLGFEKMNESDSEHKPQDMPCIAKNPATLSGTNKLHDAGPKEGINKSDDSLDRFPNQPFIKIDKKAKVDVDFDDSEEGIMDAVAGTNQSEIVQKIDSIILASLANVKDKYTSESVSEDTYNAGAIKPDIILQEPATKDSQKGGSVQVLPQKSTKGTWQKASNVSWTFFETIEDPAKPNIGRSSGLKEGIRTGQRQSCRESKGSDSKLSSETRNESREVSLEISAQQTCQESHEIKPCALNQTAEKTHKATGQNVAEGHRKPGTEGPFTKGQQNPDPGALSGSLYNGAVPPTLDNQVPVERYPTIEKTKAFKPTSVTRDTLSKPKGSKAKRDSLIRVTNLDDYMTPTAPNEKKDGLAPSTDIESGCFSPSSKTRAVSITLIEKTPVSKGSPGEVPRRRLLDAERPSKMVGLNGTSIPSNISDIDPVHGEIQRDSDLNDDACSKLGRPSQREQIWPTQTPEIPHVSSVQAPNKKKKVKAKGKKKTRKHKDKTDENADPNLEKPMDITEIIANDIVLAGQGDDVDLIKEGVIHSPSAMDNAELPKPSTGGIAATSTPEQEDQAIEQNTRTIRMLSEEACRPVVTISPTNSGSSQVYSLESSDCKTNEESGSYLQHEDSTCQVQKYTLEQYDTPRINIGTMPSLSKRRKLNDDSDHEKVLPADEIRNEENQHFERVETSQEKIGPFHSEFLFTPAPQQPTRWRNIAKREETFAGPRESAKKARPTSVPDVYVLARFDAGSLSNLGVLVKGDGTSPSSSNIESSAANNSLQIDPSLSMSADEGPNLYDPYSMRTKSMDELDARHSLLQDEQRDGLVRSLSGGALHENDPFTLQWGAAPRQVGKSKYKEVVMPDTFFGRTPIAKANVVYRGDDIIKAKPSGSGVQFKGQNQIAFYHTKGHVGTPGSLQTVATPARHPRSLSVPTYPYYEPSHRPEGMVPPAKSKGRKIKDLFKRSPAEVVKKSETITRKKTRSKTIHNAPQEYHAEDSFRQILPSTKAFVQDEVRGKKIAPYGSQPLTQEEGQTHYSRGPYSPQQRGQDSPYEYRKPPDYQQVQSAQEQQRQVQRQQQQYPKQKLQQMQQPFKQYAKNRQATNHEHYASVPQNRPFLAPSIHKKRISDPTGLRGKLGQTTPPNDRETEIW